MKIVTRFPILENWKNLVVYTCHRIKIQSRYNFRYKSFLRNRAPVHLHLRFVLPEDGGEQSPDGAEVGSGRAAVLRRRNRRPQSCQQNHP